MTAPASTPAAGSDGIYCATYRHGSTCVRVLACALQPAPTRRRAEIEAVDRLLAAALPGGYTLAHDTDGAPRLIAGGAPAISVSHSRTHAAVALAPCGVAVGIDIETPREQLRRVAPRVLSPDELAACADGDMDALLRAWTLKEALYKAARVAGADFRRDIHLPLGHKKNEATVATPCGAAKRFVVLHAGPWQGGGAMALVVSP